MSSMYNGAVQAAKETLLDRTRRRLYDRWRDSGVGQHFPTQEKTMTSVPHTHKGWLTCLNFLKKIEMNWIHFPCHSAVEFQL